jgi:signal transduction histidine kinase
MSHELRTPLNAISGWATILQSKPRDPEKLDRGLEAIARNARAQTRIIGDLLDVSRIVTGKLRLSPSKIDVAPTIHAAVDVVRPAAEGKGVRLVVDLDPGIGATMADPERLQQIVWNLLTNAVRFTPRGGRVTVFGDRTASGIVIRRSGPACGLPGAPAQARGPGEPGAGGEGAVRARRRGDTGSPVAVTAPTRPSLAVAEA